MKVSIIIPIYNGECYIQKCLESLRQQTYHYWEAICVNDGSKDNSEKLLLKQSSTDSRIKVISKNNEGVVKARELGIKHANGEYIMFLDIDDTLTRDALQLLINKITEHPEADIVVSGFNIVVNDKIKKVKKVNFDFLDQKSYLKRVLTGKNGWELWAKIYRKSLFDSPLKSPAHLRVGEDAAIFIQLITHAQCIIGVDIAIYNYIQYKSSVSHIKSTELAQETLQAAFFIENILQTTAYYHELKHDINAMFLLFYSNSTRRGHLKRSSQLLTKLRKEHFSFAAFSKIPFHKTLYILANYWLKE